MSEEPVNPVAASSEAKPNEEMSKETKNDKSKGKTENGAARMIVRMWPKTPVLWPMAVAALVCALLSQFYGAAKPAAALAKFDVPTAVVATENSGGDGAAADTEEVADTGQEASESLSPEEIKELREKFAKGYRFDCVLGMVFVVFFAYALFAVCIDFEVRWSLIAVAITIIGLLVVMITNIYYGYLPDFLTNMLQMTPYASPQLYLAIFLIWFSLMIVTLLVVRFHYIKIESNELVVVGGFLEKQKRLSTFRMRYVKEVQDVMEYYLPFVRSGRLIFTFPGEEESVVIDNVHHIDRVIEELDRLSSTLNVDELAGSKM